jgi:predicted TIM-barrel fold metal-dependent hydrolase
MHRPPRRFVLPRGSCDCHAHVIGNPPSYPHVENRSFIPQAATPGAYLDMLDAIGMDRGVLVQVSVHGTDNRLLVETLESNPGRLRGVAVINEETTDKEIIRMKEAGVVGIRVNTLFRGGAKINDLARLNSRCKELGWHLQFLIDIRSLPDLAPLLRKLSVPFVIDHLGHMPVSAGIDHPGFQTLLDMLRDGLGWVKLSGAFRVSQIGPPDYHDTIPFARALYEAAPDRMVWGSDWPHVAYSGPMPKVGDLLDLLADWVPETLAREAILITNPVRLYKF